MKYIGIGMIWIGYALAVSAVAFGAQDVDATGIVGVVGAICAAVASCRVADSD